MLVIPEVLFSWRKMQGKNIKRYQTLSQLKGSSITARRNILYILEHRYDLQAYIAKLVSSYSFRKRFLYDSIVTDKSIDKSDIESLNLKKKYLEELMELHSLGNHCYHRLRVKMYQMSDFVKLFGLRGVLRMIFYGYCKLRSKRRMIKQEP